MQLNLIFKFNCQGPCSGLQSSTCRHIVCQVWLSFGTATRTESLRVCPGCCLKMLFFRLVVSGCFSSSFDAGRIGRPAFFVRVATSFIRLDAFTRKSPSFEKERTEPFPTPKVHGLFQLLPDIFKTASHIFKDPFPMVRDMRKEIRSLCEDSGFSRRSDYCRVSLY